MALGNYGGGASIAFAILGQCNASGCTNLRVDNITFNNWAGHANAGISYGMSVVGNMFGVIDHNTINGVAATITCSLWSFRTPAIRALGPTETTLGISLRATVRPIFSSLRTTHSIRLDVAKMKAASEDWQPCQGGGRVVVRFNQFNNMDNLNFSMGWHGTESNGRPRSTRAFEYYGNTFTCTTHCDSVAGARGGTRIELGQHHKF